MVYFVGAGTGAADLITVRGMRLLQKADVIIYAGSLVNPELLDYAGESCEIYNSAKMTLDEVIAVMKAAEADGKMTVRLHTGEPSIYGAVREQMDELDTLLIPYESCPGVSACFGAAASLNIEYTLPGISQSLIITRMEGRTKVGATAVLKNPRGRIMARVPMTVENAGLDLYTAKLQAGEHSTLNPWDAEFAEVKKQLGNWRVAIEGWEDTYGAWLHLSLIHISEPTRPY